MADQITFSRPQARVILRALKDYLGLLETKLKDIEKDAREGIPGMASEYARTNDEIQKVKHLITRIEGWLNG